MVLPASVRVSDEVVSQLLGEEMILLNLKMGVYWGLNRTGAVIWQEIVRHGDVRKILTALRERYDAPEEQIASAVENLLAQLLKERLVVTDGPAP